MTMTTNKPGSSEHTGDYVKANEPAGVRGGWAALRWYTGTVVGFTPKLIKPLRLCIKLADGDLILIGKWKNVTPVVFAWAQPGDVVSVLGHHKADEVWSCYGKATLLGKVEALIPGEQPIEEPAPVVVVPEALPVETGGKEWVPISAIGKAVGLTTDALRPRAESGEIPAVRRGRNWYVHTDHIDPSKKTG